MAPYWCAIRTTASKKSSSTQVVVGLCGKEIRIIFGLRDDVRKRSSRRLRNVAGSGRGSRHACPSAISTPYWWIGYAGFGDTTASPGPITAKRDRKRAG